MRERRGVAGAVAGTIRGGGRAWPATLSSVFVELDFELLGDGRRPIRGRIHRQPFGDLTFLRSITSGHAHRVTRSERLIQSSRHNNFFIGLLISGGAVLSQEGRVATLRPGDIAILDSTRVYSIDVPQSFDALWISAPRHRIEGRLRNVTDILATKVDGRSGVGHVASQMLHAALMEAPRLGAQEANRVANSFLDLIGVALAPGERQEASVATSHRAATLRRVHEFIESRLEDETLSPAVIARASGVSVRYLSKLFAREGKSLSRWIRMRRLERCRMELEDPQSATRRISDIAFAHGFKNVSHFNRVFREHFRSSPRALRQRNRDGHGAPSVA